MKRMFLAVFAVAIIIFSSIADAKGGFSSGGGSRGGSSSAGRSYSSGSSYSRPSYSAPSSPRPATTTTTTTRTYASSNISPSPVMYGGLGSGYHYSNGMLTGLIIGNMMHPHNTVVYAGPGAHSNNALLYPDGRVVNQHGQQVGTYVNGNFTSVENGAFVAQQVPADAHTKQDTPWYVILLYIFTFVILVLLAIIFFSMLFA